MAKRYFQLEEANALLPLLERELIHLQNIKRDFEDKYEELELYKKVFHAKQVSDDSDALFTLECEIEFLQIEASAHLKNFELQGVEVKDIDSGLIDFPSYLHGEEVLLCWKQGEQGISHYHGINEGFAGRKKLT
ncbi:cell division protein DivIVA [Paenibacillus swuensis]|uniref:Cell division protein DivIVA n=1 Tax=Paenibacillus swuensis TaxID=1178515 RepID=A0A172TGU6_9BACL|nr:DUF2203 domain-containing protein [Paenibacillus swuensis]ANE46192.1 cell division protein DivIVA [Paenibacillus swuensis]